MSTATLRVLGFAITAIGALLTGVATTRVWISIGFRRDVRGVLDSEFTGTDLGEGIAVLILAAATLVCVLAARRAETSRLIPAAAIVAFGIAVVALTVWVGLRAEDRAVDEAARVVAGSTGLSVEQAAELIRTESELAIDVSASVAPPLVGGALIVIGGVMTVLWVRRFDRASVAP